MKKENANFRTNYMKVMNCHLIIIIIIIIIIIVDNFILLYITRPLPRIQGVPLQRRASQAVSLHACSLGLGTAVCSTHTQTHTQTHTHTHARTHTRTQIMHSESVRCSLNRKPIPCSIEGYKMMKNVNVCVLGTTLVLCSRSQLARLQVCLPTDPRLLMLGQMFRANKLLLLAIITDERRP